ncbi:hypothetical protein [Metabacillus idriensis]|uniref:hypothetical protein n=1 Tax=Metabacillus idriensis TaxID=324768 RepID=UPI00163AA0AD|nr:hypothetical protein [Metabacillus idriensis]QNG59536.1 hypothetical protein H4O14_17360 [Bacillus sp. PAMC26568]
MGKLSGVFEKFMENLYDRHDEIQRKQSKWLNEKDKELGILESSASKFEKRMDQMAEEAENWMAQNERHLK